MNVDTLHYKANPSTMLIVIVTCGQSRRSQGRE